MTRSAPKPLSTRPRVSVVIPCYNYGHYLPAAVGSALDQPGVDVDVLIVDDASPDGSAAVARELAAGDDRVDVLVHEQNRGHIATYNDGLAKVSGDYIVLLSADDLLTPGALTRATALMERFPSVGLVYGHVESFTDDPPVMAQDVTGWTIWPGRRWLGHATRTGRSFIHSPEAVMRREAFDQTGGYDPRLPHSGDFYMWMHTAARWDIGRVNGPTQALYRVHEANMHLTSYAGWLTDLVERKRTFDILFDEGAPALVDAGRLRGRAMRALSGEALRRALILSRDGADRAGVQDYVEFARATTPSIDRSLLGIAFRLGPGAGRRLPGVAPRRFASRVKHHLLWRRWRRYGR